jgi:hypothetical protein
VEVDFPSGVDNAKLKSMEVLSDATNGCVSYERVWV